MPVPVPAVDWVSLDYYRRDAGAWEEPEAAYARSLYPKMFSAAQRAVLVPGAFGRKNDVCAAAHCGGNASLPPCCPGQTNHSGAWWDRWSATVADRYWRVGAARPARRRHQPLLLWPGQAGRHVRRQQHIGAPATRSSTGLVPKRSRSGASSSSMAAPSSSDTAGVRSSRAARRRRPSPSFERRESERVRE